MSRLFDKLVKLTGTRGESPRVSVGFKACQMDGSLDSPFDEQNVQSARRNVTIIAKVRELGSVKPQIGDIVTMTDGRKFAVKSVQPFYDREIIMDCRAC